MSTDADRHLDAKTFPYVEAITVCMACGKVRPENGLWDVSCEIHSVRVKADRVQWEGDRVVSLLPGAHVVAGHADAAS